MLVFFSFFTEVGPRRSDALSQCTARNIIVSMALGRKSDRLTARGDGRYNVQKLRLYVKMNAFA
jgi:hypothetical protein